MSNDLHNQIRSTVRRALYGTLGIPMLALPVALAQQATNQTAAATGEKPVKMEKTVVTGSLIPTAETVGPAPVQMLSNEAITQAGTADALLTLKKLAASFLDRLQTFGTRLFFDREGNVKRSRNVEVGISTDVDTEIVSGLDEGMTILAGT